MQLAQCIIIDILKPFHVECLVPEGETFCFDQIHLLDETPVSPEASSLYVGTLDQVRSIEKDILVQICIVCIGPKEEALTLLDQNPANLLLIPGNPSLASVANRLYSGFDQILKWCSELEMAILAKKDYQTIISLGTRIFGDNPIIMVNSSYNLIAGSLPSSPSHERIDAILKKGYYSKEMTDGLARMGYQANGTKYTVPTILYPPNYMDCPLMVLATHADNGIFLGFITVYFTKDDPTPAQFELFSWFARKIRRYYLENSGENSSMPTPLEVFMADLIDHTREDETFLEDRARSLRLPLDAAYRLCVIQWDKFILPQADYIMNRLRSCLKFPFFRVLLYHQSVLLLLQGDISSLRVIEEINESFEEFGELLHICQGHAGFSTANFPLLKMNIAYRQAVTAARYGMMLNPEAGIYFYSHYYIYEMLEDYKKRYSLEDMSVQKLRLLRGPEDDRYDNLALLRNYLLTERSISGTAKIMHMHRNSVIYRLNKIQEILGLDLDDPDVRLRLLISFKILELQNGHILPAPVFEEQTNGPVSFYE